MANNEKDEASESAINSPSNVPTFNQARFDWMGRRENNDERKGQGHVNENPGRFRKGGQVERGLLLVKHWMDHEDENQCDDEEHPSPSRRPHG
ncbi:hypothetical protein JRO89_XS09G0084100 [Xanthoceras sorbifolium]|uniref:Uncharacterized protein n=1 Tax=Xanthoceras sorbifolium TaxID=99658 RepID=A0ABQ8HKW2_9ROSI|nr:hypothetical protein JRO89_XS09G0084100 [Xanthoceras sorbifolium]